MDNNQFEQDSESDKELRFCSKLEKVPKPKRVKPVNVKKVKQEKVRRFDEDDFEEDSYQVPDDLRYLISDRGFD